MRRTALISLPVAVVLGVSCSSSASSPAPAAAPAPAPTAAAGRGGAAGGAAGGGAAAQAPAQQGAGRGAAVAAPGAPAGGGGGGGRGAPLTLEQRNARRDSIAAVRAQTVKDLMASIAGRENDSATKVFKNVQMMRSMTASQLLTAMDQGIGRALNAGCESCHQLNNFASDSVARKGRARIMLNMVNTINTDPKLLNALGPGRGGGPRSISCVTCHRGGQAGRQDIIP